MQSCKLFGTSRLAGGFLFIQKTGRQIALSARLLSYGAKGRVEFYYNAMFLFNKNFYKNLGTINHTNKSTTWLKLSLTSTYFMINIFLRHTECFSISIAASFVDDICKLGDFS